MFDIRILLYYHSTYILKFIIFLQMLWLRKINYTYYFKYITYKIISNIKHHIIVIKKCNENL